MRLLPADYGGRKANEINTIISVFFFYTDFLFEKAHIDDNEKKQGCSSSEMNIYIV